MSTKQDRRNIGIELFVLLTINYAIARVVAYLSFVRQSHAGIRLMLCNPTLSRAPPSSTMDASSDLGPGAANADSSSSQARLPVVMLSAGNAERFGLDTVIEKKK